MIRWALGRAGRFMMIILGVGAGLDLLACVWLGLGVIDIEHFVWMLADGAIVLAGGVLTAALWIAWLGLAWLRVKRRIRPVLTDSLSGTPPLAAPEGRTGPVEAAGTLSPALPDSSTISDLASYRRRQ